MICRLIAALALVAAFSNPALAIEATLPRHPAPSPDGTQIAFSWQGDLWLVPSTGGDARRITAHPADERRPVWSQDGTQLAFASDRHGSYDVFVMPVDGSAPPLRLTHASLTDVPTDFTRDGSAVLFHSRRAGGISFMVELLLVPTAGGTPRLAQDAFGQSGTYSPDGEVMAFVRGSTKWYRRGYRGPASRDLWLATGDGRYRQLTTFDGDDDNPSWVGPGQLVYISTQAGRKNLFQLDIESGQTHQLTSYDDSAVRNPRASANGRVVAYEFEDGIWTIAPEGGEPTRLAIDVPADLVVNPIQRKTETKGASHLNINHDGRLAAFTVHGDVFITEITSKDDQEIANPVTVQITATPERDQEPVWSPDGKSLIFSSAQSGVRQLYSARPANRDLPWIESFEFNQTPLTDSKSEATDPVFSPDGKRLAYTRGKGDIVVIDTDGGNETVILEHWDVPDYRWSPDGQWLAYSVEDMNANAEIWIVPAEGGTPYNVSRHPDYDRYPRWSPDGRRLVWLSNRHAGTQDVWGVWLTLADDQRTAAEWLKVFKGDGGSKKDTPDQEKDDNKEGKKEGEPQDEAPELPEVIIDFDRMWERTAAITDLHGDEGTAIVSPDGKTVVFTAESQDERDLYKVRWDGQEPERLTTGGESPRSIQFDAKGKTLFYLNEAGAIKRIGVDGKAGDPVPFKARFKIDLNEERRVIFDEAWMALDTWFYDSDFHGADWSAQRQKYRPWALAASTMADFSDVVNLMIGEANASHMGYYARSPSNGAKTGFIGAFYDPQAAGRGLMVREVLPDSPAARHDVNLVAGERLLAVNNRSVDADTNINELFADTIKERVPVRILGVDGQERSAVVIPVPASTERQLRYAEWVRERRRLVELWSGGRLGYVHVESMDMPSFEEFERGLFAAADGKEGLLIDVRSNGGGWTTDYLMTVLMVQRHAYTVPRDADPEQRAYPTAERLPLSAWTKPALTICNEESYSNAEIFSHAFKTLGRGKVLGIQTFGAVISTGGTTMMNGDHVRLPMRGWYVASNGVNMELNGAIPDIVVAQPPDEDRSASSDTQLRQAVDVLLEELVTDPRRSAW